MTENPDLSLDFYLAAMPVFVLAAGAVISMMMSVIPRLSDRSNVFLCLIGSLGLASASLVLQCVAVSTSYLEGSYVLDELTMMGQWAILAIAVTTALMIRASHESVRFLRGEIVSLFLMIVLGFVVLVAADEFMSLFVGLEISSIALYALIGYVKPSQASREGAVKYLILGSFASAFLLYGVALLYAYSGSLRISMIFSSFAEPASHLWVKLGAVFIMSGLSFKMALAPFHQWAPDAYEAAPTSITGFMATSVKVALLIVLLRFLVDGMPALAGTWIPALVFLAMVSVIVGNVLALIQSSLKRMLAYSSVAHSGYMALGLTGFSGSLSATFPADAVVFYVVGYSIVSLGAFAILMWLETDEVDSLHLDDLSGLAKKHPWKAFAMTVFMLSLAGLPPTVGFMSKFFVFSSAISGKLYALVVVAVLGSAISLFYYLRVIVRMYMSSPVASAAELPVNRSPLLTLISVVSVTAAILLGTVLPGYCMSKLSGLSQKLVEDGAHSKRPVVASRISLP